MSFDIYAKPTHPFGPHGPSMKAFNVSVKFTMEEEGSDTLLKNLERVFNDKDVLRRLMEQVVVRSIIMNIRRRFLANIENAVEMQVLTQNGEATFASPRVRMRANRLKGQLRGVLERLTEAQMAGDGEEIMRLQGRAAKLSESLREKLAVSPSGKRIRPHYLSAMAGHMFRVQMMQLLGLLTDPAFVRGEWKGNAVVVGVAPIQVMESLRTPSATPALTGHMTGSRKTSFWRQLEFGTGMLRTKGGKERLNIAAGPVKTWRYGYLKNASLWLYGTKPMDFLTTNAGLLYEQDKVGIDEAFIRALHALLTA